ncbi:MAG: winged helix-turn-helix domain-containing protein [Deltaproteobacteria bacterium]|nr:winged helix-turn-helix domain-containing protein [Deltaproteobacteria bacterium]
MGRKRQENGSPSKVELLIPTLQALIALGGSGAIEEINSKVYEIAQIKDDLLQIPHGTDEAISEVDYQLHWSRTYLKKYGLLENSSRGIWDLSKADLDIKSLDPKKIIQTVVKQDRLLRRL